MLLPTRRPFFVRDPSDVPGDQGDPGDVPGDPGDPEEVPGDPGVACDPNLSSSHEIMVRNSGGDKS